MDTSRSLESGFTTTTERVTETRGMFTPYLKREDKHHAILYNQTGRPKQEAKKSKKQAARKRVLLVRASIMVVPNILRTTKYSGETRELLLRCAMSGKIKFSPKQLAHKRQKKALQAPQEELLLLRWCAQQA